MGHYDDDYIYEADQRESRLLRSLKSELMKKVMDLTKSEDARAALVAFDNRNTLTSLAKLLDDLRID